MATVKEYNVRELVAELWVWDLDLDLFEREENNEGKQKKEESWVHTDIKITSIVVQHGKFTWYVCSEHRCG